ncbi:G-type lectin S-receptor-like serine/threonine-protein kinase At2g19130 [Jatropha curcas]|uniref:G-type lectin S-receptor-like serine/threonine-protein kinase At2g19130 n=1 Tax=Jatropha curcas TaxID=180498 RepID=UPI0005FAB3F9|nr:G-type lectin S-receptor-like serine/threonine-protein kinase At2g19130 [Jatropha curcas]
MDVSHNPWLKLSVLVIFFSLNFNLSLSADRITANQSLSGDQTIISSGGTFKLGFFKPGNTSNYYIGMWYNRVSQQTIVWVANRQTPISDRFSSELAISNGNLVLLNESKIPIWSTNLTSNTSNSVEAILLDDGNFILNGSVSKEPLWQSFDHPANTWLPGAKVGLNKITGENTRLISWRTDEDPAPGLFSLELDPKGTSQYYILWNNTKVFWTSGTWNGQIFSLVPEMRLNYIYNFSYETNANENYFTYSLYNNSIISRFVMDIGGQIQQQSWLEPAKQWNLFWSQPRVQCEVYAYCGAFGSCSSTSQPFCHCLTGFYPKSADDWNSGAYSAGCIRRTTLQCGNSSLVNGKRDKFLPSYNIQLPENPETVSVGSAQGCESHCLNNCSCSGYSYDNNQCLIWIGDLLDVQVSDGNPSGKTLYVRLAASEVSSSKNNKGVVIGAVVGSIVVVVVVVGLVLFVIFKRKRRSNMGKAVEGSLIAFEYRDLQNATKNFSEKLGGGGFGSVFKGTLPDSSVIAVKKLESIGQGEKQFRTEVSTIGTIQHVNLVRLRGFCSEGTRKLLVYDYMPNGSLDFHIFHEKVLDWNRRYNFALGTARGLTYLHEKCRDCIIHCDIKPENILLDGEFCPKVADFGLAKLVGRDFSRVLTTMRGTRGYLAPEWISGVAITAKADVYSYGMMLFELVSGRRNSEQSEDGTVKFFPSLVARQITEGGDILTLVDPRLGGNADLDELTRLCKVACWCIQDDETQRPSMGQVVQILEGVLTVNLPPIPRSLQVFVDEQEHIIFFTESSSGQSSQSQSQTQSNNSIASSQAKSSTSSITSKS